MAQAIWNVQKRNSDNKISNVKITITDRAGVVEGEIITAVCNGKTFSSEIKKGMAKLYTSEVGTYTITAGEYSTMLICPYYGQFSTDIYSGVLKVICTESGGSDKTCQVRSCDDNYNFTDKYNLTQTFSSSLELTFMGLPTGKYLVTLDGRYRFFKEVTSIQNINEIEVGLKQWLYKDGDECLWNTGGWMKCYQDIKTSKSSTSSHVTVPATTASQSVDFLADNIRFLQSCSAAAKQGWATVSDGEEGHPLWGRNEVGAYTFIGTKKTLPIALNKYSKLNIANTGSPVSMCIRTGAANSITTTISTASVVSVGTGTVLNFNTNAVDYYIVVGKEFYSARVTSSRTNVGDINYSLNCSISGIYLT